MIEQPVAMKIDKVIDEAKGIKTFFFRHDLVSKPGQFVMLWLPGYHMKPFGVSFNDGHAFAVTVCRAGPFSAKVLELKKGDKVGMMGPYGQPFGLKGKNPVLIAGGYGAAPLAYLADELLKNRKVTFIIGARTRSLLLYTKRFSNKDIDLVFVTENGSYGQKGYSTDYLEHNISEHDIVYTVGPEIMMKKVIDITDRHKRPCQLSLERYMKCGFGVCGQCAVDPDGLCICKDGPVFDKKIVKKIKEFGKYKRDASGSKVYY